MTTCASNHLPPRELLWMQLQSRSNFLIISHSIIISFEWLTEIMHILNYV